MAEQEQNRSEQATPFKLEEARKQGQVAKSLDFNTLVMIWGLLGLCVIWGASAWDELATVSRNLFTSSADLPLQLDGAAWMGGVIRTFIGLMAPVLIVGTLFAVLANLIQTGPIFTFKPLKPKGE